MAESLLSHSALCLRDRLSNSRDGSPKLVEDVLHDKDVVKGTSLKWSMERSNVILAGINCLRASFSDRPVKIHLDRLQKSSRDLN